MRLLRAIAVGNVYGLIYQFDNTQPNRKERVCVCACGFFLFLFLVLSGVLDMRRPLNGIRTTRASFPVQVNEIFRVLGVSE